jgi:tetratricopeptide (TPR) repeat protein
MHIFINYRRDDSIGMAGRLYDRFAQTFGRDKLFMDVDHIPAGVDFVEYLNSRVAECKVILVVIGVNWLSAKDESGDRRLDSPDDFVAIEIAAALARDIRVIPVLVNGASMPKVSELPEPLKPLARRQAVEVRDVHFRRDADALVETIRETLTGGLVESRPRRATTVAGVAAAVLLLVGWIGFNWPGILASVLPPAQLDTQDVAKAAAEAKRKSEEAEQQRLAAVKAEEQRKATAAAEAEAKRKSEEAEQQRLAAVKAEEQRKATAAAEAEAKRKSEEAEQQRLAAVKAEEQRKATAAAEAEAKRKSEEAEQQRLAALKAEEQHKRTEAEARARYSALMIQGVTDANSGDYDKAITIFSEAIKLDPENGAAFGNRGLAYAKKGDFDQAIADFNAAIRLNPDDARAFCNRGIAKLKIKEKSGNADIAKARRLDASLPNCARPAAVSHRARSGTQHPRGSGVQANTSRPRQQPGAGVSWQPGRAGGL